MAGGAVASFRLECWRRSLVATSALVPLKQLLQVDGRIHHLFRRLRWMFVWYGFYCATFIKVIVHYLHQSCSVTIRRSVVDNVMLLGGFVTGMMCLA